MVTLCDDVVDGFMYGYITHLHLYVSVYVWAPFGKQKSLDKSLVKRREYKTINNF